METLERHVLTSIHALVHHLLNQVHLEKPVVRLSLNLNEVWNLCRGGDLGEIYTLRCITRSASEPLYIVL